MELITVHGVSVFHTLRCCTLHNHSGGDLAGALLLRYGLQAPQNGTRVQFKAQFNDAALRNCVCKSAQQRFDERRGSGEMLAEPYSSCTISQLQDMLTQHIPGRSWQQAPCTASSGRTRHEVPDVHPQQESAGETSRVPFKRMWLLFYDVSLFCLQRALTPSAVCSHVPGTSWGGGAAMHWTWRP